MSSKKPNLTIQIQQLGQQFNSKFKGYIQQPNSSKSQPSQYHEQSNHPNYHLPQIEKQNQQIYSIINHSQISQNNKTSQRSIILAKNQQIILENRLAQNVRSLSKNKWKKTANGQRTIRNERIVIDKESNERSQGSQGSDYEDLESKRRFFNQKKQIGRSKSATNLENSRAKILQQIAQKLGKVSRIHTSNDQQNQSLIENSQIKYQKSQTKSQVEKIKQIKQNMQKTRAGKLQHLMKNIKKSNQQSFKVVYTIKKSIKSSNKRNNASPIPNQIEKNNFKQQIYTKNGYLSPSGNLFQTPQTSQSEQNPNKKYGNNQLNNLAQQLQNVRFELKQVKQRNDQLLQMSKNQKFRNSQDQGIQSSRLTNKIIQFDLASLDSSIKNKGNNYTNFNNQSNFVKASPFSVQYTTAHTQTQGYHTVRQPIMIQACFACGCTCMNKGK